MCIEELKARFGQDVATLIQHLWIGVAFLNHENHTYDVFSHEGDYVATYNQNTMESLVCRLRQTDNHISRLNSNSGHGFTLAF
jgi:glucokinase